MVMRLGSPRNGFDDCVDANLVAHEGHAVIQESCTLNDTREDFGVLFWYSHVHIVYGVLAVMTGDILGSGGEFHSPVLRFYNLCASVMRMVL